LPPQRAPICETLRSSCEVDRFGVQLGDGLLIERLHARAPPQFPDQRRISQAISGAKPHIRPSRWTFSPQVVRPKRTRMNRHHDDVSFPPRHDLDFRHEPRLDGISHQVREALLERCHRPGLLVIGDAAHVMLPVGGVGINCAIADAVEATNVLALPCALSTPRRSSATA
jgi:2-polyprenyl-6-methoxyphenol hydroxylase-like FAD-dependent oxidoreductase